MKIQYLSDLHLESHAFTLKHNLDADVVVLAGDITTMSSLHRFDNLLKEACKKPVIYTTGNHEYYNSSINRTHVEIEKFCDKYKNFHYLNDSWIDLDGIRFVGSTLFTDFKLQDSEALSKRNAQYGISDFHCIWNDTKHGDPRIVTPDDYQQWHKDARAVIRIAKDDGKPTVVVTHFCPAHGSVSERWKGSSLNPFFTSDCSDLMGDNVKVWIHGHTHDSCDYLEDGTHVVCNPRGYTSSENNSFKSTKIVEVK